MKIGVMVRLARAENRNHSGDGADVPLVHNDGESPAEFGGPDRDPLPGRTVAAYSVLTLPTAALGLPITVYLPPFYANELGMGLALVGLVFTIARLWDVVTDPIMGVVIDRFPSRWGRRRHWIVMAAPILMLSTWFIYMPSPGEHAAAYLLGWLFVLYVGYTFLTIAHQSWGTELTANYNERSRLFGWREALQILGMVTVLALPAVIEHSGGDTFMKIASMGWYLVILLPIATFLAVTFVPERPAIRAPKIPFNRAITAILQNKPLRRVLVADISIAFAIGVAGSTYIFLATWVFVLPRYASAVLLAFFVSGLVFMPLWMRLSYQLGKHATLIVAMAYACTTLSLFPLVAGTGNLWGLVMATVLYGGGFGAGPMILRAMMADLADLDELETGANRAGLLFALLTTTNKVGGAVSVSVSYAILSWIGFDPAAGTNTPGALSGLLWTFVVAPSALFILAGVALWRYPLDKHQHTSIQSALEAQRSGSNSDVE